MPDKNASPEKRIGEEKVTGLKYTPPKEGKTAKSEAIRLYPIAKAMVTRAGARHSRGDNELIQQIHDMAMELGASCYEDDDSEDDLTERSERDYKKEYREYHGKSKQKKERAKRNAARRKMIQEGRAKNGDGKEVDHRDGNPNNNSPSNLRVVSRETNRKKG